MEYLPAILTQDRLTVVLLCRVSTDDQDANRNLDDGTMHAWRHLRAMGCRPVTMDEGVETSNIFSNRTILEQAIEEARRLGAMLVAPSRDRFIRSRSFGRGQTAKGEPPCVHEYEQLIHMAEGVLLATLLPPDEPSRSRRIKRGQDAKGRKGGRPRKNASGDKKDRRERLKPHAAELLKKGMSQRAVAAVSGIRESTLRLVQGVRKLWQRSVTAHAHDAIAKRCACWRKGPHAR